MGTRCAASPRSATPGPLQWLLLAEKTTRPSACYTGLAENGLASSGSPPLAIMTENQNVLGSTLEVLPSHFNGLRLVQAANGSSATQSLSPPLPVLAQSAPPGQALLMPHLLILPAVYKDSLMASRTHFFPALQDCPISFGHLAPEDNPKGPWIQQSPALKITYLAWTREGPGSLPANKSMAEKPANPISKAKPVKVLSEIPTLALAF